MIKVLYYCDPHSWGGAEVYLARLLSRFDGRDMELHLAVPKGEAFDQFVTSFENTCVILHPYEVNPKHILSTIRHTYKLINNIQPDLVHFNLTSFHSCRYSIWAARWLCRVPVVLTVHLLNPDSLSRKRFWLSSLSHFVTLRAMRGCDKIITVSKAIKNQLIDEYGVKSDSNFEVIYNAIDVKSFFYSPSIKLEERLHWGLSSEDFVVILVARLEDEHKAQSVAIEAVARMPSSPQRAVLLLVGDGPSREMLEAHAERLAVGHRVIFTGHLSQIARILNTADVAILPSRREGLPFALLEAMACRLSVVASRVGGIPEVVEDEVSGLLVEPANAQQLTTGLCRLYADSNLRERFGMAAQTMVQQRFSFAGMIEATLNVYEQVMVKRGTAVWSQRFQPFEATASGDKQAGHS